MHIFKFKYQMFDKKQYNSNEKKSKIFFNLCTRQLLFLSSKLINNNFRSTVQYEFDTIYTKKYTKMNI